MSRPPEETFTNHLNSPFSAPQADRSENVGLEAILAHVARLRNPELPSRFATLGGLFTDLSGSGPARYTPERRAQLLQHYEAYLSRIHIFEQVIRAEALVRYLAKSLLVSSPHVPQSNQLSQVSEENGNLLSGIIDLLDSFASTEETTGTSLGKANATLVRRLIAIADATFFEPLVNFRNRIAHGYSRAFHTQLRRRGRAEVSDATATEIFTKADLISATCIVDNLDCLSLLFYRLPFEFAKNGTFSSQGFLEDGALRKRMPFLHEPNWIKTFRSDVHSMPGSNLRQLIITPQQGLQAFWQSLNT